MGVEVRDLVEFVDAKAKPEEPVDRIEAIYEELVAGFKRPSARAPRH